MSEAKLYARLVLAFSYVVHGIVSSITVLIIHFTHICLMLKTYHRHIRFGSVKSK